MKHLVFFCLACALGASGPSLAEDVKTLTWVGCGITKKAFMQDLALAYEEKTGISIEIQGGGATRGIQESAAKRSDMGGSCRYSLEESSAESAAYLEPVAWDALVAIVHKDNPVNNIGLKDLRDVYLGRITNWKQLGGRDAPIDLYARQGKISGVGYTFRRLVFANPDQVFASKREFKSTGPLEKALQENPNALAVTGISSAHKRDVKILTLDGKEPSPKNISSGDYTLYRPLYISYNVTAPNRAQIEAFIRFAHSSEGKAVIRKNQVVPYTDALALVMKQLDQERRARDMGLYQ